jgi:hypothetical protein
MLKMRKVMFIMDRLGKMRQMVLAFTFIIVMSKMINLGIND